MLKAIQAFFESRIQVPGRSQEKAVSERALQLATAALLIEMSRADFRVRDEERRMLEEAVRKAFALSAEETAELIRLAEEEARRATSLYEFTHLIDRGCAAEQKKYIVELLWRVALSDAQLEKHEEHLVRKIAKLLHVRHLDFIDAKLRARKTLGSQAQD